jgi:hypothetical protein
MDIMLHDFCGIEHHHRTYPYQPIPNHHHAGCGGMCNKSDGAKNQLTISTSRELDKPQRQAKKPFTSFEEGISTPLTIEYLIRRSLSVKFSILGKVDLSWITHLNFYQLSNYQ